MPEYAWMCLYKQDSEYALGPKYAKILNMTGFSICEAFHSVLNMPEYALICSKYARVLKMQEFHRVLNMPQYD